MKPADDIKRLFNKAGLSIRPDADEQVYQDMLAARRKSQQNARLPRSRWRITMKSPITKLAIAAAVVIACAIGLSFWRTTGSGIALADVLAQIEKVKAFRCQWSIDGTLVGPDKPYSLKKRGGGTFISSQEYGCKTIFEELNPNGTKSMVEVYMLSDKRTVINISHKQKKYWRTEWPEPDARAAEDLSKFDPRTLTKRIMELEYESLGRSTVDGIEVEGLRTTDPNFLERGSKNPQVDLKAWVDAKRRLPVRYDLLWSFETDSTGNRMVQHMVMDNFQWDVPIDAAEFELVIPHDYTGVVVKYPEHPTEETALQGLKVWVELLGKYPDPEIITNIDGVAPTVVRLAEKSDTPAAVRLREETKGLTDDEISNQLVDFLVPIRGLAIFYSRLQQDKKDPAYYGKTVTPKDADKVLMRWKLSDNEYRVIFGDLHAETVSPERLAELEKAPPK